MYCAEFSDSDDIATVLGTLAAWKLVILGGEGGGVALATGILASVVDPYSAVSPPITEVQLLVAAMLCRSVVVCW